MGKKSYVLFPILFFLIGIFLSFFIRNKERKDKIFVERNRQHNSFEELLSKENWKHYEKLIFTDQNLDPGLKLIESSERKDSAHLPKKSGMWIPEEIGKSFHHLSSEKLTEKLLSGDKIEQRKAANTLWNNHLHKKTALTATEKDQIDLSVRNYLSQISKNFEENQMQIQRLWHLAVPELLRSLTDECSETSENATYLLSLMKTPDIIQELIRESVLATDSQTIKKYIFALEYMKINNPFFLPERPRMSDQECRIYFATYIFPHLKILRSRLPGIMEDE